MSENARRLRRQRTRARRRKLARTRIIVQMGNEFYRLMSITEHDWESVLGRLFSPVFSDDVPEA